MASVFAADDCDLSDSICPALTIPALELPRAVVHREGRTAVSEWGVVRDTGDSQE